MSVCFVLFFLFFSSQRCNVYIPTFILSLLLSLTRTHLACFNPKCDIFIDRHIKIVSPRGIQEKKKRKMRHRCKLAFHMFCNDLALARTTQWAKGKKKAKKKKKLVYQLSMYRISLIFCWLLLVVARRHRLPFVHFALSLSMPFKIDVFFALTCSRPHHRWSIVFLHPFTSTTIQYFSCTV